jgi:very-short-patch-repair endonuclease
MTQSSEPQGCLGMILRALGLELAGRGAGLQPAQVRVNKYFITNAEADFFRVLRVVVADRGHILAQVSLRQLLWLPGNNHSNPGRSAWQNKIAAKSVDFVICDPATLRPRLVIELDEPSHARPERQIRDEEVELMLNSAGLPFVRVITSRSYNTRELAATILPYLTA